jgi:hypothetical protein
MESDTRSTKHQKASAPDKLLFGVSIDPRDAKGLSSEQIAIQPVVYHAILCFEVLTN